MRIFLKSKQKKGLPLADLIMPRFFAHAVVQKAPATRGKRLRGRLFAGN